MHNNEEGEGMKHRISKTAAIAQARRLVSIDGRYTVIGPYRDSEPRGPCTEIRRATYVQAQDVRAAWAASLAVRLMGVTDLDVDYYVRDATGSVLQRVAYALAKVRRDISDAEALTR